MPKPDFKQIAGDAYKIALRLHSEKPSGEADCARPDRHQTRDQRLIDSGMTNRDFLASFSLNRALRRNR